MISRPCNSKSRQKHRYTRKELETIAKSKGIQHIASKTMDQLCQELKLTSDVVAVVPPLEKSVTVVLKEKDGRPCSTKTRAKNRYTKKELVELAKQKGIPSPMTKSIDTLCRELGIIEDVDILKVSSTQTPPLQTKTCLIDIQRPCSSSSSKNIPNAYRLKELKELWKSECKHLPEFKGEKPSTLSDYCRLLRQRYGRLMFRPLESVPTVVKQRLSTWFSKLHARHITKQTSRYIPFRYAHIRSVTAEAVLHRLSSASLASSLKTSVTIRTTCSLFEPFNSVHARTISNYLYNRNVFDFNNDYLMTQTKYVLDLTFEDKYCLVSYTYAGDKIVNTYLLNQFNVNDMITDAFVTNFKNFLFPLAWEMWNLIRSIKNNVLEWEHLFFPKDTLKKPSMPTWDATKDVDQDNAMDFYLDIMDDNTEHAFIDLYHAIIRFVGEHGKKFRIELWHLLIDRYIQRLTTIIQKAPPVPSSGLMVYRGVRQVDFLNVEPKRNVFVNQLFMSTSVDMCTSLSDTFTNPKTKCCLFAIQVLPKAQCVFVGALTFFDSEIEFLFAPGSHLFMTRSKSKAPNCPYQVVHFALVK